MGRLLIESYIEKVKRESKIHKFLKEDVIYQLINCFEDDCTRNSYTDYIKNPLEIALKFYENYNSKYYNMILTGIDEGKIIIDKARNTNFVDTASNIAFISLTGNDSDLFLLVHEFAHFIDRNLEPPIIPDEYNFLCEVFSFYIEKKLEHWLDKNSFSELVQSRRNNRIYYETKMLKAIEYEMFYEKIYNEAKKLNKEDLDINKVKLIERYNYDSDTGLVNYLLRYPLANVLSEYLIDNNIVQEDICKACLNTNLYEILSEYNFNKKNNIKH